MEEKQLQEIKIISFSGVNCYLVMVGKSCVLLDTGFTKNRVGIEQELDGAGCSSETLNLIVLTHGDFDHSGNAVYLRGKYGAKIAIRPDDKGMVENGDLFYNRKINPAIKLLGKFFLFFSRAGLKKADRFTPDIYVNDGSDLSQFGIDAKVVYFPGHSKGSIGILTSMGDLFCGDLLENTKKPAKNSIIADKEAFNASMEKLEQLKINKVYPGHGKPFKMELFTEN